MKHATSPFLYLAWLASVTGMLISLYGSEVMQLPICHLCWYQRICLYPMAIILGIACYKQDNRIAHYTLPLCVLGLFFAAYQYAEQMIPGFAPLPLCGTGISCSDIHFQWLGFVTLPLLSLFAFAGLALLLVLAQRRG